MTKSFLKTSLLSLTASTILVSGLNAIQPIGATLDLETYSRIIVHFDGTTPSTVIDSSEDVNFVIKNNTTDDNLTVSYVDDLNTSSAIFNITGGKEGGTGNDLNATEAVKKVRGNTQNGLVLDVASASMAVTNTDTNFTLLTTIGTLAVENDTWNLVTLPAGVFTNAKEIIKANKATMIWGWELNSSIEYNWVSYPNRMEPGRGYWIRTRIAANTAGSLGDVVASDYNLTLLSDYDSLEVNASNFAEVVSMIPIKDEWVLLGNSGSAATINSASGNGENNSSTYFFEDLLNVPAECYFVSIYHWTTTDNNTSGVWVNDTEGGSGTVPANAGVWVKQRLCNQ